MNGVFYPSIPKDTYAMNIDDLSHLSSQENSEAESEDQEEVVQQIKNRAFASQTSTSSKPNFKNAPSTKPTEFVLMNELCEYSKKLESIGLKIATLSKKLESNEHTINKHEIESEYKNACNQFQLLQKDIDADLKKYTTNMQYIYEKALEKEVLLPPPANTRLSFIQNLQALTDIIKNVADFLSSEKTSLEPMNPAHKGKVLASLNKAFDLAENLSQDLRRQLTHVKKLSRTITEYQGSLTGESPSISSGDESDWTRAQHQDPPAYDRLEGIQRSFKKYLVIAQNMMSGLYQKAQ